MADAKESALDRGRARQPWEWRKAWGGFLLETDHDAYIPPGSSTAVVNGWKACECERCVELLNDLPLLPFVKRGTLGGALVVGESRSPAA